VTTPTDLASLPSAEKDALILAQAVSNPPVAARYRDSASPHAIWKARFVPIFRS
jgi:hypothetical protein